MHVLVVNNTVLRKIAPPACGTEIHKRWTFRYTGRARNYLIKSQNSPESELQNRPIVNTTKFNSMTWE